MKEKLNTIYLPKNFFPSEECAILLKNKTRYCNTEILKTTANNYFSTFWEETQIWQKNIQDNTCGPSAFDSESNICYEITPIS